MKQQTNYFIFGLLFVIVNLFLFTTPGLAAGDINPACPSVYGVGCPAGQLFIDKKVQNPRTGELVDSISANDATFIAGQDVNFRIEIKNTGSAELTGVGAHDKLPDLVNFISGQGEFKSQTLSWGIDILKPGESKFFQIKAQVKPRAELPQTDITCVTNFVQSQKDQNKAQDTTVFCIQAQVAKVEQVRELPKTGLPPFAWAAVGLAPLGLALRRFSTTKFGKTAPELASNIWRKREFEKD